MPQYKNGPYKERAIGVGRQQADPTAGAHADAQTPLSILLVDDDPGIRMLLSKGLAAQGHQLYEANDGATGLAQFHEVRPELIFLDINMPGPDGFAVLKEIRRCDVVVGVIMASALNAKPMIAEALLSGADGYLTKPLRLPHVFAEVQQVSNIIRQRQYSSARQRQLGKANHHLYHVLDRQTAPALLPAAANLQAEALQPNAYYTASVLFVDFCSLQTTMYNRKPDEVVQVMNQYLTLATAAVMNYGGYIDKFMGDGFMAIFDADQITEHAIHAVCAAVDTQLRLQQFEQAYGITAQTRIGIHSGEVLWGNLGTLQLMKHTAIGDTVILAKHLEELAALGTILVSEETQRLINPQTLPTHLQLKYWGNVALPQRHHTIKVYETIGL